ncbi:MAG TPA: tetratricopeptide repeat protein [Flavisolibacter sp.]|nr:tetratricopeptide repeat protein [Flavisolibacter sp.]
MRLLFVIVIMNLSLSGITQNATQSIIKGNQLYQQSQFDLAEIQYRKALEYEPENERARYNLANALQRQTKYDEAAKLLEDLAGSSKDNSIKSAAYYNQGVAYTKMKNLDASIESYKKALRTNPNDQQARENLEKALLQKKNQKSSSQQKKSQSSMSQKEAQQKLDMLNQKEKQLHQRKDKEQQGSGQAQDW